MRRWACITLSSPPGTLVWNSHTAMSSSVQRHLLMRRVMKPGPFSLLQGLLSSTACPMTYCGEPTGFKYHWRPRHECGVFKHWWLASLMLVFLTLNENGFIVCINVMEGTNPTFCRISSKALIPVLYYWDDGVLANFPARSSISHPITFSFNKSFLQWQISCR